MDLKDLSPEERDFLRKYRELDGYDRYRVENKIKDLEKNERKSKFKICDPKEAKK